MLEFGASMIIDRLVYGLLRRRSVSKWLMIVLVPNSSIIIRISELIVQNFAFILSRTVGQSVYLITFCIFFHTWCQWRLDISHIPFQSWTMVVVINAQILVSNVAIDSGIGCLCYDRISNCGHGFSSLWFSTYIFFFFLVHQFFHALL